MSWPPTTHQHVQDEITALMAVQATAIDAGVTTGNTGTANRTNLAAWSTAHPGKPLFLPAGTYDFDASLTLTGPLLGSGYGTVLRFPELATACLYFNTIDDLTVADLKIVSTSANTGINTASSHGVLIDHCTRFSVRNVHVTGELVMGIHLRDAHQGTVTGCSVVDTLADGIHLTLGSTDVTIAGNHMSGTGDDGIALITYEADAAQNERIAITANTVTGGGTRGIVVEGAKDVTVTGNVVDTTVYESLLIDSITAAVTDTWGAVNCVASGNVLKDSATNGVTISGKNSGVLVRGNIITSPAGHGVNLLAGRVLIDGNIIDDAGSRGIIADAPVDTPNTEAVITGNLIRRAGYNGIYAEAPKVTVSYNTVQEPNQVGGADRAGIQLYNITGLVAVGNRVDAIDVGHTSVGIWLDTVTGALVAVNWASGGATAFGQTGCTGIVTT